MSDQTEIRDDEFYHLLEDNQLRMALLSWKNDDFTIVEIKAYIHTNYIERTKADRKCLEARIEELKYCFGEDVKADGGETTIKNYLIAGHLATLQEQVERIK